MSDEQQGAMHVFRATYEAHVGSVYRCIYSRVGNREEAEDLTTQVFMKALNSMDWTRVPAEIHQWLMQVTRTTLADHWRTTLRLRTTSLDDLLAGGWQGPEDLDKKDTEDEASQQLVAAILAPLPERYQQILRYRFLLGYSIRDTALAMNITEANVKIVQMRALKRAATLQQQSSKAGVSRYDE